MHIKISLIGKGTSFTRARVVYSHSSFQPLRCACEAYSSNVSARNVFRDFRRLATTKALRGGALCAAVLEDDICLPAPGKLQLHAFVLMPEHVHLLLTAAEGVHP